MFEKAEARARQSRSVHWFEFDEGMEYQLQYMDIEEIREVAEDLIQPAPETRGQRRRRRRKGEDQQTGISLDKFIEHVAPRAIKDYKVTIRALVDYVLIDADLAVEELQSKVAEGAEPLTVDSLIPYDDEILEYMIRKVPGLTQWVVTTITNAMEFGGGLSEEEEGN